MVFLAKDERIGDPLRSPRNPSEMCFKSPYALDGPVSEDARRVVRANLSSSALRIRRSCADMNTCVAYIGSNSYRRLMVLLPVCVVFLLAVMDGDLCLASVK